MTIDTMLHVAMEHYKQGQLPEAERMCREILAKTPENSYALHLLGVIAGQVGRIEIAVQLIEKAVALHPGEAFFHCNLAKYCIDLGRFEQALKETQGRAETGSPGRRLVLQHGHRPAGVGSAG